MFNISFSADIAVFICFGKMIKAWVGTMNAMVQMSVYKTHFFAEMLYPIHAKASLSDQEGENCHNIKMS